MTKKRYPLLAKLALVVPVVVSFCAVVVIRETYLSWMISVKVPYQDFAVLAHRSAQNAVIYAAVAGASLGASLASLIWVFVSRGSRASLANLND